jgi:glycosyltransferase involved in cell wall biosynthesis
MSNALLEAMAAGNAIVATDVGANREVLAGTGLVVPPKDDAALASAMRQLLDDPALAHSLGVAARKRVETHYSREAMKRQFEEFYTTLAGR